MKSPVKLILDTDMGNDIDDALALAMLHALQARGECELAAVVVSKDNPYAPAYVDVINTFYGYGETAIGKVRNGVTPLPEKGDFIKEVVSLQQADGTPLFKTTLPATEAYPDAVDVLRAQLAAADDAAVVIVMIGFSTNLAQLFRSGADAHSPLDGLELFARKVKHVVMMAANFSPEVQANLSLDNREYNIRRDVDSACAFISACPRPIIFSGLEVGLSVLYPAASLEEDYNWCSGLHPVVEGYKVYLPMPYDRPTWDLTAVLYAVRPQQDYFGLSAAGTARVSAEGIVRFEAHAGGKHRHLTLTPAQRERVYEAQRQLVTQPPRTPVPHDTNNADALALATSSSAHGAR